MEKPYTKEQLIECIGILDNYLAKVESFLDEIRGEEIPEEYKDCLLYTSPSPRDS